MKTTTSSIDVREMPIHEILVVERHRRDMGDLDALAESIADLGLLHPVVVNEADVLVAGERRLRACRDILKWKTIPTRIIDLDKIVLGEHAENEMRKDFTVSERVDIGKAIEATLAKRQGQRTDTLPEKLREVPKGTETAEVAAQRAGFGNERTYRQAKAVVAKGEPELVKAVDEKRVSINAAAAVAEKPRDEQREIVAKGEKEILRAARQIKQQKKAKAIEENPFLADPTPKQQADATPGVRWAKNLHDCWVIFNGLRDHGGLKKLTASWSATERTGYVAELRQMRGMIDDLIRTLE